ncbi:MAG TPA: cell division protein FtsX [Porphyromonadaceae bacterium]|nr:cell division protein FtsX [Porphyromonadaceae bacterium]
MTENKKIKSTSFFNSRLTSMFSVALVLFLLGSIFLLARIGDTLSSYVKESISFSIVLKENAKQADIDRLQKRLAKEDFVKSTLFISKEQAAKELEAEIGENPETFLGFNPLSSTIEIKLNSEYANPDSLAVIERQIKTDTQIEDLLYRKDMMQIVNENVKRVGIILLGLAAILSIISFALINNTIRLHIYSKRFLIHTMKLVGATPGFIRRPFIRQNLASGFMAGLLALAMLAGALYYANIEIPGLQGVLTPELLIETAIIVLGAGMLLTTIATWCAVNKYIKMKFDKLYYI